MMMTVSVSVAVKSVSAVIVTVAVKSVSVDFVTMALTMALMLMVVVPAMFVPQFVRSVITIYSCLFSLLKCGLVVWISCKCCTMSKLP